MTTTSDFPGIMARVHAFARMLKPLDRNQRVTIGQNDTSRAPAFSSAGAQFAPAYAAVTRHLERTYRDVLVGPAWLVVHQAFGQGGWTFAARPVVEALLVWEFLTEEQRLILWAPFAQVGPPPVESKEVA